MMTADSLRLTAYDQDEDEVGIVKNLPKVKTPQTADGLRLTARRRRVFPCRSVLVSLRLGGDLWSRFLGRLALLTIGAVLLYCLGTMALPDTIVTINGP